MVFNIDDNLKDIKEGFDIKERRIKYLEDENKRLKDEAYKDNRLIEMQEKLESMRKDYFRGFPISEKENEAIEKWRKKHDEEVHGLATFDMKLRADGVSGGRYSYHFVPTSLGTSGTVRCGCGAEFEFQEIG